MEAGRKQHVIIAKIQPLEEFGNSSSLSASRKLFEFKPRLRKFSKKSAPSIADRDCDRLWKINREQEEFCIDSPLRAFNAHPSVQATFVFLDVEGSKSNIQNSIPVRMQDSKTTANFFRYATSILFPTLHNVAIETSQLRSLSTNEDWTSFLEVSERYAKCLSQHLKDSDIVLILDYELMMLPKFLAEQVPNIAVGFLFKTPFPTSEIFRCIPQRKEILESLLQCALINFMAPSHGRHFFSACTRILGADSDGTGVEHAGKCTKVSFDEFSLDTKYIDEILKLQVIPKKGNQISEYFGGKTIVFGIDGISQQASVLHKLKAIEELLKKHPSYRSQLVFVQICYPEDLHQCNCDSRISQLASWINSEYGTLESPIIHYFEQNIDFDEYFALLTSASCYLDCSESQIFNSALFEFIYCQQAVGNASLILSEMSHWAKSLSGSIICNPWDHEKLADSIHYALQLLPAAEKERMHIRNLDYVKATASESVFVNAIQNIRQISIQEAERGRFTKLSYERLESAYGSSSKRLFILDYDGTLVPIRKSPDAAHPTPKTIEVLSRLARNPNNTVFVVSGRDKQSIAGWLGNIPGLGLSAEHGSFIRFPHSLQWADFAGSLDAMDWKTTALEILNYFMERTPGSFVEHKQRSFCWHYRLADPEFGSRQANECQMNLEASLLSKYQVEILLGKKVIEVRSSFCNKGICIDHILKQHSQVEFIFCAGDDRTDEDMFRVLESGAQVLLESSVSLFTCIVGSGVQRSVAKYRTENPNSLLDALLHLT